MLYTTIAGTLIEEIKKRKLVVSQEITNGLEKLVQSTGTISTLTADKLNAKLLDPENINFFNLLDSFVTDPANCSLTRVSAEGSGEMSPEEVNDFLDNDGVESSNNNSPPVENNNPLSFSVIGAKAKAALSSLLTSGELSTEVFLQAFTLADKISQSERALTSVSDFATDADLLKNIADLNAQELIEKMLFCNQFLDYPVNEKDISHLTDFEIPHNEGKQAVRQPPPPPRQNKDLGEKLDNDANPLTELQKLFSESMVKQDGGPVQLDSSLSLIKLNKLGDLIFQLGYGSKDTDEIKVKLGVDREEALARAGALVHELLDKAESALEKKIIELGLQINIFSNSLSREEDFIDFNSNLKDRQFLNDLSSLESKLIQQLAQETRADKEQLRAILANVNEIQDLIGVEQVDDEERLSDEWSLFDASESLSDASESLSDESEIHDDIENRTGLENISLLNLVHIVESSGDSKEDKEEFTQHLKKLKLNLDNVTKEELVEKAKELAIEKIKKLAEDEDLKTKVDDIRKKISACITTNFQQYQDLRQQLYDLQKPKGEAYLSEVKIIKELIVKESKEYDDYVERYYAINALRTPSTTGKLAYIRETEGDVTEVIRDFTEEKRTKFLEGYSVYTESVKSADRIETGQNLDGKVRFNVVAAGQNDVTATLGKLPSGATYHTTKDYNNTISSYSQPVNKDDAIANAIKIASQLLHDYDPTIDASGKARPIVIKYAGTDQAKKQETEIIHAVLLVMAMRHPTKPTPQIESVVSGTRKPQDMSRLMNAGRTNNAFIQETLGNEYITKWLGKRSEKNQRNVVQDTFRKEFDALVEGKKKTPHEGDIIEESGDVTRRNAPSP